VGSNKPHKNLVRLVQAWQPVHQQFRDVALMIAGAWDNRYPQPKEWVEKLGLETAVHFFGPVTETELPILYSRAQLFVFPTLYEGFGLPVIEAMACGTAVACSNQSSLPEVGGDAAVYFNPANTEEITQSIITILKEEDLQTALQKQALQQAKKFTWEQTAKQTTAVYKMIHQ
jgi:alpha-1,3-rhamnosyl/mannosyltransferase